MNGPTNHTPKNAFLPSSPPLKVGAWRCASLSGKPYPDGQVHGPAAIHSEHCRVMRATGLSADARERDRLKTAFSAALNGLAQYDRHDDNHWMKNAVAIARRVDLLGGVGAMREPQR